MDDNKMYELNNKIKTIIEEANLTVKDAHKLLDDVKASLSTEVKACFPPEFKRLPPDEEFRNFFDRAAKRRERMFGISPETQDIDGIH